MSSASWHSSSGFMGGQTEQVGCNSYFIVLRLSPLVHGSLGCAEGPNRRSTPAPVAQNPRAQPMCGPDHQAAQFTRLRFAENSLEDRPSRKGLRDLREKPGCAYASS